MKCKTEGCENEALTNDAGTWRRCAACMDADEEANRQRARNAHARFMRKRTVRKEREKVRQRYAFLSALAAHADRSGKATIASAIHADESRLRVAEERVKEAERMLKEVRVSVREYLKLQFTQDEINDAIAKTAEANVKAREAAIDIEARTGIKKEG